MVKKAIMQERNSQFDQEAALHLLSEEKEKNQLNLFFCEYTRLLLTNLLLQIKQTTLMAQLHQVKQTT